jgi:hypothetical protein
MTQVIETEAELIAEPSMVHPVVLQFISDVTAAQDAPLKRTILEYYADVARPQDLPIGVTPEALSAFVTVLGRRPRRHQLLSTARDLVEMSCLSQTIEGFALTAKGRAILNGFAKTPVTAKKPAPFASELEALAAATKFEFNPHGIDAGHPVETVSAEYRGHGLYAVTSLGGKVLNKKGSWEYESSPSNRTEDFIARTRFPRDEAIVLAKKYAVCSCVAR